MAEHDNHLGLDGKVISDEPKWEKVKDYYRLNWELKINEH